MAKGEAENYRNAASKPKGATWRPPLTLPFNRGGPRGVCKLYKKHRPHAEREGPPGNGTKEGKGFRGPEGSRRRGHGVARHAGVRAEGDPRPQPPEESLLQGRDPNLGRQRYCLLSQTNVIVAQRPGPRPLEAPVTAARRALSFSTQTASGRQKFLDKRRDWDHITPHVPA